jgi:two-component system nitrogen regulation response regulator NtrX
MAAQLKRPFKKFSDEALAALRGHAWPGNVRELRNLVERVMILTPGEIVGLKDLPDFPTGDRSGSQAWDLLACSDFQDFKNRSEARFLQTKLIENQYNVSKTAERLKMQRSNLYKKITKYELQTQPEE